MSSSDLLEDFHLQIDDRKSSQFEMVEKQVDAEFFAADLQRILAPNKCEAYAQFQKKVSNMVQQPAFKFAFLSLLAQREKVKAAAAIVM